MALLLVIICFIWVIVLQNQVSDLQRHIAKLKRPDTQPSPLPEPQHSPQRAPSAFTTVPAAKPDDQPSAFAVPSPAPVPQQPAKEPLSFVKLFSWIGGILLLLGILFALKYTIAFISPQQRICASILLGILLWTTGAFLKKPNLRITAHTLMASGLAVCFSACFCAYHFYHLIPAAYTVCSLAFISLAMFATAVWKRAQFICVLAQIAGFLTPLLVSTPSPDWTLYLTYIFFLSLAAVSAALWRGWNAQLILCAVFTGIELFIPAQASPSPELGVVMGAALVFGLLFAAASAIRRHSIALLISACFYVDLVMLQADLYPLSPSMLWWVTAGIVLYSAVPFICKNQLSDCKSAWAATILMGMPALWIQFAANRLYPSLPKGLLFLLFAVIYAALTALSAKWQDRNESTRSFRLAGLGALAVIFLTWAIGIQFKHEWLTIALSLEGCALIWLNRRFAHKGLVWAGKVLLCIACIRLTFNPEIADYRDTLQNWYWYVYTLCAGAMFLGAYGWPHAKSRSAQFLYALGGWTMFALVNIEIAYFFAQNNALNWDMFGDTSVAAAFTLAWALCGAGCLAAALALHKTALRYTGIVLVCLALAKLFLSDIWYLTAGIRIIVLLSVAMLLILTSFAYQRFKKTAR